MTTCRAIWDSGTRTPVKFWRFPACSVACLSKMIYWKEDVESRSSHAAVPADWYQRSGAGLTAATPPVLEKAEVFHHFCHGKSTCWLQMASVPELRLLENTLLLDFWRFLAFLYALAAWHISYHYFKLYLKPSDSTNPFHPTSFYT